MGCDDISSLDQLRNRRETESSTGKHDIPKEKQNENILSFEFERCEPSDIKSKVVIGNVLCN